MRSLSTAFTWRLPGCSLWSEFARPVATHTPPPPAASLHLRAHGHLTQAKPGAGFRIKFLWTPRCHKRGGGENNSSAEAGSQPHPGCFPVGRPWPRLSLASPRSHLQMAIPRATRGRREPEGRASSARCLARPSPAVSLRVRVPALGEGTPAASWGGVTRHRPDFPSLSPAAAPHLHRAVPIPPGQENEGLATSVGESSYSAVVPGRLVEGILWENLAGCLRLDDSLIVMVSRQSMLVTNECSAHRNQEPRRDLEPWQAADQRSFQNPRDPAVGIGTLVFTYPSVPPSAHSFIHSFTNVVSQHSVTLTIPERISFIKRKRSFWL